MNKSRLEAFSDGMFAIIMTIMILDLKAPHGGTFKDLEIVLPAFFCYLQSFLFVGVYWNNHHHLLQTVKKVNGKLMLTNMAMLFLLSLIPFVTAWVAETDFASEAVVIYAISLLMPALTWMILQRVARKNSHWSPEVKGILDRQAKIKGTVSLIIYISGIPFAFINPYISEGAFLLVSIMWLIPNKKLEKVLGEE
jgi:uncharacterized membrane protein